MNITYHGSVKGDHPPLCCNLTFQPPFGGGGGGGGGMDLSENKLAAHQPLKALSTDFLLLPWWCVEMWRKKCKQTGINIHLLCLNAPAASLQKYVDRL